jgi:hypothetical protein
VIQVASVGWLVAARKHARGVPGFNLSAHRGGRPVAGSPVHLVVPSARRLTGVGKLMPDALHGAANCTWQLPRWDTAAHVGQALSDHVRQHEDLGISAGSLTPDASTIGLGGSNTGRRHGHAV